MTKTLLHLCTHDAWANAQRQGAYSPDSLKTEGFIHLSTTAQVVGTANLLFHGRTGLIVLLIDSQKLTAPIKYEDAGNGVCFPHLYGPLNLDAVYGVNDFEPSPDGNFEYAPSNGGMSDALTGEEPWRVLRVGDRVRMARIPSEFSIPGARVADETGAIFRQLVAINAILTIAEIDEFGHPWTESFDFDADGALVPDNIGHTIALADDSWDQVGTAASP